MPRFDNSSTTADAADSANNRNGQVKFQWSFSYEVDLPNKALTGASGDMSAHSRAYPDDLGALLDKALAFAG